MAKRKNILPLAAMEKILKKNGAVRISDSAKEELSYYLETLADKIAKNSWFAAIHAGRKTIKREDIELATKR